ncbi:MAG: glutamate-5-semialdehyde dehydrogenase [Wenzhouxiangellaceae bacterium]|nr:glutamate-5-semialdehyde dehydrogenase [Wenzhouxiangellaceae bacterium]
MSDTGGLIVDRPIADGLIADLGARARRAASRLARAGTDEKNRALTAAAEEIRRSRAGILEANRRDVEAARSRGVTGALLDRLMLDEARLETIAAGLEQVAALPDPVGRELARWTRPNGLEIARVAVPIGVIGVIYEARPNVTADAAALCLKAGNAVILRGGSEAVGSNRAIHAAIAAGLEHGGLAAESVQMVPDQDRALVGALLAAHETVDVIVPRGGRSLVERVQRDARVPVFAHLDGNNHLYWHPSADPAMAIAVIVNSKMRRPGICGALETLLVDRACLDHLPRLVEALAAHGCELRGDEQARAAAEGIAPADEADWATEYLAAILAIRTVDSPEAAIEHIAEYGSAHTDGILADDEHVVGDFLDRVDSAIVVHNASTQFADGGEFGFGAEIGIATGRLHARGPVGLEQLTTFNYRVRGTGQTRP